MERLTTASGTASILSKILSLQLIKISETFPLSCSFFMKNSFSCRWNRLQPHTPVSWHRHTGYLSSSFLVFLLSAGNGFANISLQEGGGKEPILTTAKKTHFLLMLQVFFSWLSFALSLKYTVRMSDRHVLKENGNTISFVTTFFWEGGGGEGGQKEKCPI